MNESSRALELNSQLAECEQIYRTLESVFSDPSSIDSSKIPPDRRRLFATAIYYLLEAIENVEHLLRQVILDGALQNIAHRPLQFYREELAPKREHFETLLVELLEMPDIELDRKAFRPDSESSPVWNILVSGLDFWEMDDSGMHSPKDLQATRGLVYSPFFKPDEWLRNVNELEPVLGPAAELKIPSNVRIRLKELYRSFILGNYLSAVALARAILEYALVDHAAQIDIRAYSDDPRYPNRTRTLGVLVRDASEKLPELKAEMEAVLEAGNQTLHPKKKDKLVLLPSYLRHLAKASIQSVRKVVEKLYLRL